MIQPSLATLLSLQPDVPEWEESDYAAILEHQLDAPINLAKPRPTFRQVLTEDHPEPAVLNRAKQRAKQLLDQGRLPRPVAEVLYYWAITRGIVEHHVRITSLADSQINTGIRLLIELSWLPVSCRRDFQAATQVLSEDAG